MYSLTENRKRQAEESIDVPGSSATTVLIEDLVNGTNLLLWHQLTWMELIYLVLEPCLRIVMLPVTPGVYIYKQKKSDLPVVHGLVQRSMKVVSVDDSYNFQITYFTRAWIDACSLKIDSCTFNYHNFFSKKYSSPFPSVIKFCRKGKGRVFEFIDLLLTGVIEEQVGQRGQPPDQ